MSQKIGVPKFNKKEIKQLALHIRPIIDFGSWSPDLYFVKKRNIFQSNFLFNPEKMERVDGLKPLDKEIVTYHTYVFFPLFAPKVAEVLAQIPSEQLFLILAFQIVASPDLRPFEVSQEPNSGFHKARTRLFVRK